MNKKILAVLALFILMCSTQAKADQISFIWDPPVDTFQGVDGDTSGWSHDDSMLSLGTNSWDLLGATAEVDANVNGLSGILTHRGTRGLGILGGEDDEIDNNPGEIERLVIKFDEPKYLNSFEVRSLFYEDNFLIQSDYRERGMASFWLDGDNVFIQRLVGVEDIGTPGTKGVVDYSYAQPYLIDKIVFNIPAGRWYSNKSEFSVAKLDVTAVPEPVSTVLFITGGAALAIRRLRKSRKTGEGKRRR